MMKVGDLVKHMFEGRWDEVGLVTDIDRSTKNSPGGMVKVIWNVEYNHRNNNLYRMRDLEVINESSSS
jgi:hypothetical protein